MVQEAAVTAFSVILTTKRETVEPFILDIFKIVVNVFKKNETYINNNNHKYSLLNIFEIFSLLTENFEEAFRNESISKELINLVFNKWIETLRSYKQNNNNNLSIIFDMIISFVKAASYSISTNLISNFLEGILEILKINYENYLKENKDSSIIDKDLITKCFDLLSNIYISVPGFMLNFDNKNLIVTYIYKYFDLNENYLNHYCIALLGDIARVDNIILKDNINFISNNLIINLELPIMNNKNQRVNNNDNNIEMEKLSICNNSCWTIGILAMSYPDSIKDSINIIMKKLIKIISSPRLNKSLAQNISLCIGRCANNFPEIISIYFDKFLKQFCLSLRNIKDSIEKQEAFT
jgi:hypothetical protein